MNQIEIKRSGKMIHQVSIPGNWNELSPDQYRHFLKLQGENLTTGEMLDKMAIRSLGKLPASMPSLNRAQMDDLAKTLFFLVEKSDLIKQLIPEFKLSGITYYGPTDALSNLKWWEFLKASDAFTKASKTKALEDRNKFIAILYRPAKANLDKQDPKFDGDPRELFNENHIQSRAEAFAKLPEHIRIGIEIYFKGSFEVLKKRFPDAFEKSEFQNDFGIHGLVDAMAGEKFGRIDQVKDAYLYEVMISICQAERNRKKLKK